MKRPLTVSDPVAGGITVDLSDSARLILKALAYVFFVSLTLSPLLWASIPPLADYPNHLARMWILVHRSEIPELASNYFIHWRLVPNLAMDLVVPTLAKITTVETAGRLFIALTMLTLIGGTVALHRALHGRVGLWPLCSLLFIYNAALYYGFLNFLFGAGLFLWAFSGWIATRQWKTAPRMTVFSVVAGLLLILHLFAFGLYGLSVAAYEVGNRLSGRRPSLKDIAPLCGVAMQFVPALALWAASLQNSGPRFTFYGSIQARLPVLFGPTLFGSEALVLDTLTSCAYAAFLFMAIRRRWLKLAPGMQVPLFALVAAAIFMPEWLNGSWLAQIRVPVVLPFFVIASTRLEISQRFPVRSFAVAALILLGARVWAVSLNWIDIDRDYAEFREAARVISPGARLLVVEGHLAERGRLLPGLPIVVTKRRPEAYWHMSALAVIDRSVFIPTLFTGWTPVLPTARNDGLFRTQDLPLTPEILMRTANGGTLDPADISPNFLGEKPYWRDWPRNFDFVLWMDSGETPTQLKELEPIASGSFFQIYRVIRPTDSEAPN